MNKDASNQRVMQQIYGEFHAISNDPKAVRTELLKMRNSGHVPELINGIERIVRKHMSQLNTSQLRNIYDKLLKKNTSNEVQLLRPKLMYVGARQNNIL